MDTVKLSNHLIDPEEFAREVNRKSLASDPLVNSGVVEILDRQNFLNNPCAGLTTELPRTDETVHVEPNVATDDPSQTAIPQKSNTVKCMAVRHELCKVWSKKDDTDFLNGDNPVELLQDEIAKYWKNERHRLSLLTLKGLIAESKECRQGDFVFDMAPGYKDVKDMTEGDLLNPNTIIRAAQRHFGDRCTVPRLLVVHPVVFANIRGIIKEAKMPFALCKLTDSHNIPVILDNKMTIVEEVPEVVGGADAHPAYTRYYSFLFGPGAFVTDAGLPARPFEKYRNGLACEGRGQTSLISRVNWVLHPKGYRCNLETTPTTAQLESASSWTRALSRKYIPISVIITRG